MFIHIFTRENVYSAGLLNLIGKHLDPSEHLFVFTKSSARFEYPESIRKRIIYAGNLKKLALSFSSVFRNSEHIYFHYLPAGPSLAVWAASPLLLAKSTWIIWGGDIYPLTTYSKSTESYFYEFLRKKIIKKIRRIAAFVREDYDIVRKTYSTNASYSQILYPIPLSPAILQRLKINHSNHLPATVLLGNSASRTNNHIAALEILSSYKDKEIKIICPLSYGGSDDYAEQVKRKGIELFGSRFIPLTNFIKPDEYSALIADVDVAIMNHNRQQGLGNILPILFLGKKVYLRKDTSSYQFLKRLGCGISGIDELENNPENLFYIEEGVPSRNREIIGNLMSEENCVRLWDTLFHPDH